MNFESLCRRLFLLLAFSAICATHSAAAAEPAVVKLNIDYGDGVQKHFVALEWKDKLTVLDALTAAAKHPRGIKFEKRGTGELCFVHTIDDVKSDGKRNWLYRVNDQLADRSCGIYKLQADDVISWKFSGDMP